MIQPPDPAQLSAPAQRVLGADAPRKLQLMAAKGVMPGVKAQDILATMVLLGSSSDAEIAAAAQASIAALPPPVLKAALQADLHAACIDALVPIYLDDRDVVEPLLRMRQIHPSSVEVLASRGSEVITELVATNEERLLGNPRIIELLYLNQHTRMSTADRLVELAVRNGIELHGIGAYKEAALAIKGELVPERSEEPLPDDEYFRETRELAEELAAPDREDVYEADDTGEEKLQDRFKPLYKRLADMTISQKIRAAMLGTKEERMMLVRDHNKLVSTAAIKSPQMQEAEVALIAHNRGVSEDVLRIIGMTPEWMKSYQVKKNLVENSKTPIAISQKLITHLREADLRRVARDKNIASAVQQAARRHLQRRKQ